MLPPGVAPKIEKYEDKPPHSTSRELPSICSECSEPSSGSDKGLRSSSHGHACKLEDKRALQQRVHESVENKKSKMEEAQQQLAQEQTQRQQLQKEMAALKQVIRATEEVAKLKAAELATALKKHQDYIGQLLSERSQIGKKLQEVKADLITFLQNDRAQHDRAREQVLELDNELVKMTESLQAKERELAAAKAAAAAAVQAVQSASATAITVAGSPMLRTDTLNVAAITIQRFVRGMQARRRFEAARAAVLTIQCAARAWAARKLTMQLRREKAALTIQIAKLLQDKKALEQKVHELQSMLETVQDAAKLKATELATALKKHQDYIGQLMSERSRIDKKFQEMKADLITRLQNACAQRDEARGRVLELDNEYVKMTESLQAKERELAAANAAASAAAAVQAVQSASAGAITVAGSPMPATTPVAASTAANTMHSMFQKLQTSAPGYARNIAENISTLFTKEGAPLRTPPRAGVLHGDDDMRTPSVSGARAPGTRAATMQADERKEAGVLKHKVTATEDAAKLKATELATALKKHQDYIDQLMRECNKRMAANMTTWKSQGADEPHRRIFSLLTESCHMTRRLLEVKMLLGAGSGVKLDEAKEELDAQAAKREVPSDSTAASAAAGSSMPAASSVAGSTTAATTANGRPDVSAPVTPPNVTKSRSTLFTKDGSPLGTASLDEVHLRNKIRRSLSFSGVHAPGTGPESEADRRMREAQLKQVQILAEKRKVEEDKLLAALAAPLPTAVAASGQDAATGPIGMGFHRGRPVAAIVIFRYCLHARAFQADRTAIFDRIVSVIGQQVECGQEDNNCLSYWLSNTVTLLHMLNKHTKPASGYVNKARVGVAGGAVGATRSVLGAMFGSRSGASPGGLAHAEASIHSDDDGGFKQVEAKYPALLFKQQLDAIVQKIFPMIRDNVRKEISPMLSNCIYAPKTSGRTVARPMGAGPASGDKGAGQQAASHKSWMDLLHVFDTLLAVFKANVVPKVLVQALFKQLFRFINVQLFNQLLLRRERCSFSNGEYVKTGLEQVAHWINRAGADYIAGSWEELKYLRQAVTFLATVDKPKKSLEEITSDLCRVLSIQQLYRISTMYWDDKYNEETVSPDVLSRMKQAMVDSNSSAGHSFLLDDESGLPFQAADLLANMDDKVSSDCNCGRWEIVVHRVLLCLSPWRLQLGQYDKTQEEQTDGGPNFAFLEEELCFAAPAPQ
ncbi:hypothetical protein Agub_g7337 [Astrephomene gubernaculifera]|uniref:Dilute domain-containing protein n=1 Tax=Astrephomene gubernaculifera TaxID=47775 RepID=A0AAD3DQA9_9CHLO|nr:hypothetical protein Agub_g7337 [Astrephomene gubernaculifera]